MTISRDRRFGRRTLVLGATALAAAATVGAFPSATRAAGEFRIGYQKGAAPLITLKAEGTLERLLEPLGISVGWAEFSAGAPLLEAMNTGNLELGAAGSAPPVVGQAAGTDLIYILANPPAGHSNVILVAGDSPIQTVEDLKGKKVAISKGSISEALVLKSLEKVGLTYDDVERVYLFPPDAKPAFEGGSVDAWAIWDPYYAAAQESVGARAIADDAFAGLRFGGFYFASRAFVTDHPDALDLIIPALVERENWTATHPEEVVALVSKQTGIPEATLKLAEARKVYGIGPITEQVIADQQATADLYYENGIIPKSIDIASATLPQYAVYRPGMAEPVASN